MQYSDHPILNPRQDLLGRSGFAMELAKSIDRLSVAKEGFVLAIVGGWGSGKTSVIELIVRFLRHLEMERASQLPYLGAPEPQPKTLQQLETMSEIYEKIESRIAALEKQNKNVSYWERSNQLNAFRTWLTSEEASVADEYWRIKLQVDRHPHTIVVRFSPWLIAGRAELAAALFSELARSLGTQLGSEVTEAFAGVLGRLAEFAPVAGAGLDLATGWGVGKIVSAGGKWTQKIATGLQSDATLDQLRQHLQAVLRNLQGQQIIVVIDDLDRLTPPEALQMVSLVKSLGDLPNVIYLLSYDENRLADLLQCALGIDGRQFLEKIVQYPVHLPLAVEADLARLLDADLSTIVGTISPDDSKRLGSTWYYVFRHYLQTPRHVRRFVNSVAVAYSALVEHTNLVDLIVLEALRLHEPELYDWLRRDVASLVD